MFEQIKDICLYLVIGFTVALVGEVSGSAFLSNFYSGSLLELLIILFSIDITIVGMSLTKMKELAGDRVHHFKIATASLATTVWGQIAVMFVALIVLILKDSPSIQVYKNSSLIINTLLGATLIYHVDILRDTAKALFTLIEADTTSSKPE